MTGRLLPDRRFGERVALGSLMALAASVLLSVGGMFALYHFPGAVAGVGTALPVLMHLPTWVYLVTMPMIAYAVSAPRIGWRVATVILVWGSVVGLVAELVGTSTGYPFGAYAYTGFLEPKVMGRVPVLIPLSWYATAILSFELAAMSHAKGAGRVILAAVYMVLWDVALDPAMAHGFPVWAWQGDGFFYGMPALNLLGWLGTSLIICAGIEVMVAGKRATTGRYVAAAWGIGAALPLGIGVVRGMWPAVAIGGIAVAIPVVLATWQVRYASLGRRRSFAT
jgi:carotene biosynthesis associated membrane protein